MQISPAIFMAFSAISRALRSVFSSNGASCGRRIAAARADGRQRLIRIDHVTRAGDQKRLSFVGHQQQGLKVAQHLVGAPVLCQLHAARFRFPAYCSSFDSKRANRLKASAVEPAKSGQNLLLVKPPDLLLLSASARVRQGSPGRRQPSPRPRCAAHKPLWWSESGTVAPLQNYCPNPRKTSKNQASR